MSAILKPGVNNDEIEIIPFIRGLLNWGEDEVQVDALATQFSSNQYHTAPPTTTYKFHFKPLTMSSDDNYDAQADLASQDNDYTSRPGQKDGPIPVQSDSTNVESGVDTASADSDEQLGMFTSRSCFDQDG